MVAWRYVGIAVLLIVLGLIAWGPWMSRVEQASYRVLKTQGAIEIRAYPSHQVIETIQKGSREQAIQQGFKVLADYIFGHNETKQSIAMTAPVRQIGQQQTWRIQFVIPKTWQNKTLPTPRNSDVLIHTVEASTQLAIRFRGRATSKNLLNHLEEIKQFAKQQGLKYQHEVTYAFYNPPWTLPFLRRNEVMLTLSAPSIMHPTV